MPMNYWDRLVHEHIDTVFVQRETNTTYREARALGIGHGDTTVFLWVEICQVVIWKWMSAERTSICFMRSP